MWRLNNPKPPPHQSAPVIQVNPSPMAKSVGFDAINALRARIAWLTERAFHGDERMRLLAAVDAFDQLMTACRELDRASSPIQCADTGDIERLIPTKAWAKFHRDVGFAFKQNSKDAPRDPADPRFKEEA